ncbi:MAG TPA: glucose-1-phosphate cytidylyltransferase [Candidatus Dojkabacteria bacterium]|nr:glucose-1-phosphate cytidylyltransferase [Candidatus Dojkabacteria bacterium]HRO64780.1 glucose-1-phosphate cytidylyltransferase [Candidatus Dojkabacteria bacterium]HRP51507.1 glucose-1-phosphate cytidylyltransferase [Candidatus Dojkabacteria bacterium]
MKVVILAGGLGTRLNEETLAKPKPMVEIGGKPVLWHIMKIYSYFGINEFIICCGYKSNIIKDYFLNYANYNSDITINTKNNVLHIHPNVVEDWTITLAETGDLTMTGGRLKRVKKYLDNETFCMTYGDSLTDVNILDLIKYHKERKEIATFIGVRPPARFGTFILSDEEQNRVVDFHTDRSEVESLINGGFFVLEPQALDYIDGDQDMWEEAPLRRLALAGQLGIYKHDGFWQCMDTYKEKLLLEKLWSTGNAGWKIWKD